MSQKNWLFRNGTDLRFRHITSPEFRLQFHSVLLFDDGLLLLSRCNWAAWLRANETGIDIAGLLFQNRVLCQSGRLFPIGHSP